MWRMPNSRRPLRRPDRIPKRPILAYQDVAHGQKAALIERDNRYTCNVLHRLGFHWRDTSWDYVERMLKAIAGFGFFE